MFEVFENINFSFVRQLLSGVNKRILFVKCEFTFFADISALFVNNKAFSVSKCRMSKLSSIVTMDFGSILAVGAIYVLWF